MNAPLRIVHVYKNYGLVEGGIENCIRTLAVSEAASGYDVSVLSCGPDFNADVSGVRVLRYPSVATVRSMPLSLGLYNAVKNCRADIICVHSPFPLGEAALRFMSPEVKVVAFHHSDVVRQRLLLKLYAPLYRQFLKRADVIIATSAEYASSSPWIRPYADKCRIVPLGVDASKFTFVPRNSGSDRIRLLFTGKLRYYKGLDTLINAMKLLPGNISLDIVGTGPLDKKLRMLAVSLRVAGRVHFRGFLSDEELVKAYHGAEIFVLPCNCRAEAFGTVLLEAMACGLPCITCDVGSATSSVVKNNETGIVIPPRDPEALAAAVMKYAGDPKMMREVGDAGRRAVESSYTAEKMCAEFLKAVT